MPNAFSWWGFVEWTFAGAALALGWRVMNAVIDALIALLASARRPAPPG